MAKTVNDHQFRPAWLGGKSGYTVVGWHGLDPTEDLQQLIDHYYRDHSDRQQFQQLHSQLSQKLKSILGKLRQKANLFQQRLQQSATADRHREQADLLMAYLHQWQPGLSEITLEEFTSGKAVTIPLHPEKNAVQNAQALYKQYQKLERAKTKVAPLLAQVEEEISYLEQVEAAIVQLSAFDSGQDLETLEEIKEELVLQGYLKIPHRLTHKHRKFKPYRYLAAPGIEVWVGRNNQQNDLLTFRHATEYDLWFHAQEIAGSHVLLKLPPGEPPLESHLQWAADIAAYHSRGQGEQLVPIVYTQPKYVYKPNGAKPGMIIYKREKVLWGKPDRAQQLTLI